jgi:hypothetical protein
MRTGDGPSGLVEERRRAGGIERATQGLSAGGEPGQGRRGREEDRNKAAAEALFFDAEEDGGGRGAWKRGLWGVMPTSSPK